MRRMLHRASIVLVLLASASLARADILMWRDSQGVKHYTNSKALIPSDVTPSVVLEEPARPAEGGAVATAPSVPERTEPPPQEQAQVVYDPGALTAAYAEGWRQGLAAVRQFQGGTPVSVQINGPLVAGGGANSTGVDPWWPYYYYPSLVTTSFDGGRSRHLTLRMLMQDQFAIDREGPYVYIERFPPLGPNLATFLPRGLPLLVRPGARVVNH
jgi:hypothetical protein